MATLNMGNSNIIGISYSDMNKMKSNLKKSQQMLETSQRNVGTARVQLQVDRGRLRVTEDSLSSIYSEESKRKAKIDKMCSNIDYTIRRFKEVDSRCAQRIRAIGNSYNTKTSLFDKIKNVMLSLGRYLFGGGTSLLNEGQDAFNNLGSNNSNGYYSFIGMGAGVGNYSAMANSQYSMGGLLLAGTNMFASYANKYPTIGMNYSGAGGGKVDNEDTKEDGYIWKSIKQVFLGNYTDEHTGLGSVGQIALGFTGIDFLADGRDLVYDFTHWSWTWDHGKQTAFDMIALMPIIGVSKNIKNAAKYADLEKDVLKNSEKLIDGIKPIEKGADITKGAGEAVKGGSKIADDILKQGQKALNNFDINSAYVKPKHLSSSAGKGAKFLGDTKEAAEVILKDAMSNGTVQSIADNGLTKMGQQSYQIVIDAGKEVGTKGETLIKIVISEDGGMLSAYPIK
ncbi:hypothetical protein [Clostridium sp. UBA1652]|uniref:hypothetical protein n=1 Tax=Clostridium sp. UBA1652 TaxID=1946348 RepID=UPI00257B5D1F|nr:hypothetical protein [Clostridium sp. UBA1652]